MAIANKTKRADYLELISEFPLRPIRSDAELDRAVKMIDSLVDKDKLSAGEQDYLDVLSDLVEKYEAEEHPMAPLSDAAMLRHLIEAKGVTQTEVAEKTGIDQTTLSLVLAGKRNLSRSHIARLSQYFGVEPGAFAFE